MSRSSLIRAISCAEDWLLQFFLGLAAKVPRATINALTSLLRPAILDLDPSGRYTLLENLLGAADDWAGVESLVQTAVHIADPEPLVGALFADMCGFAYWIELRKRFEYLIQVGLLFAVFSSYADISTIVSVDFTDSVRLIYLNKVISFVEHFADNTLNVRCYFNRLSSISDKLPC